MKKHYEIADIEQYFQLTNNIAPIYTKEKVHQIINMPKAPARLKGKNNNLLKFIIMTTLLAIVLSAILFWPEAQEGVPIPIALETSDQISNEISIVPSSSFSQLQSVNETGKTNKENLALDSFNNKASNKNPISVGLLTERKLIPFEISNIAIMHSSKNNWFELVFLESKSFKIGEKDSSIRMVINAGGVNKPVRGEYYFSDKDADQLQSMSFNGQYYVSNDSVLEITGGRLLVDTIGKSHSFEYELLLENDYVVSGKFKPEINAVEKEEVKNKQAKVEAKYPEQILDSTLFIELSRKELEGLGFNLNDNYLEIGYVLGGGLIKISYYDQKITFGVYVDDTKTSDSTIVNIEAEAVRFAIDSTRYDCLTEGIYPMLITNMAGKQLLKMSMPEDNLTQLFSEKFNKDFRTLLPVIIKENTFGIQPIEDIVYWFLPTDVFFNYLPQNISEELLTEYEYVTTEDKTNLEKPECKYFDECKNTLDVSSFKVFPNPAKGYATVTFKVNEPIEGKISLVDLAGRERQVLQPQTSFTKGSHRIDVDVSNVPEGIYLITLHSDKGIQTQRFIVMH